MVVESHGGHFWSTQGQAQRPLDVVSLRIDVQERMTLQLADALISPTHYMSAFLRQRGWRLPATSLVVPNVLPELEAAAAESLVCPPGPCLQARWPLRRALACLQWSRGVRCAMEHAAQRALRGMQAGAEKPVWRLAFFSRLEERKGLKLFVEAVTALDKAGLDSRFEVHFVGAESRIDMMASGDWLKERTAAWTFPVRARAAHWLTWCRPRHVPEILPGMRCCLRPGAPWQVHIRVNAERGEALDILSQPGTMLVLCSLVDNMPYVVAEAAVRPAARSRVPLWSCWRAARLPLPAAVRRSRASPSSCLTWAAWWRWWTTRCMATSSWQSPPCRPSATSSPVRHAPAAQLPPSGPAHALLGVLSGMCAVRRCAARGQDQDGAAERAHRDRPRAMAALARPLCVCAVAPDGAGARQPHRPCAGCRMCAQVQSRL